MKQAIFNTDMVRAILDGRKTNTRRPFSKFIKKVIKYAYELGENDSTSFDTLFSDGDIESLLDFSPYKKGDIIYVRETWGLSKNFKEHNGDVIYKADYGIVDKEWLSAIGIKWKPSIHMPKEYARLFLRVKDVRIERLNEIGNGDAKAEGIEYWEERIGLDSQVKFKDYRSDGYFLTAYDSFASLWESIYGEESFNDDYVWVIEFEKISKEEAVNG